jgi:hypothetical protein
MKDSFHDSEKKSFCKKDKILVCGVFLLHFLYGALQNVNVMALVPNFEDCTEDILL